MVLVYSKLKLSFQALVEVLIVEGHKTSITMSFKKPFLNHWVGNRLLLLKHLNHKRATDFRSILSNKLRDERLKKVGSAPPFFSVLWKFCHFSESQTSLICFPYMKMPELQYM